MKKDLLQEQIANAEKAGQEWFEKAISLLNDDAKEEFQKHMATANEFYIGEYHLLSCIGMLVDSGLEKAIEAFKNSEMILDIKQIEEADCTIFLIKTTGGEFSFVKLSTAFKHLEEDINILTNIRRQGNCHEKAFEIAQKTLTNAKVVTGYVSILSDRHRFLHSRVVDLVEGIVMDYTLNAGISIANYNTFMNAEPPLLEISNQDIKSGNITYNDFAKAVLALYDKQ